MRNIDWLYQTNSMFRETVNQGAAQWMGSDSPVFAGEWLLREHEHEPSDYEDLIGQHLDGPCVVPDRFCSDAAKWQISQFVAQETGKTAESDAAKSEMRDFADSRENQVDRITDMVNAKMEERDTGELIAFVKRLESAAESGDDVTLFGVDYVPDWKFASFKEPCADQTEQLLWLTDECARLRKLAKKYRAGSVAAQDEAEAWRAKCGELLDAAHEMVRIGG